MAAAKAGSSLQFRMNLEFQRVLSALAKRLTISHRSTSAILPRTLCSLKADGMAQAIKETVAPEETAAATELKGLSGFLAKFTVLKGAQHNLWLTFVIKFLIYTAYSVTNKTMVLWLSKDLGFSDQASTSLVGWVWAPAMTVFTLLAGSMTDAIGLRRTFFLGAAICTFARSVMILTTNPTLALIAGMLPLAVGEALGTPVLLAATRVYSTTAQRSMAFSIIYALMNAGYFVAGYIFDFIRSLDFQLSIGGFHPTPHEQLFGVSLALEILLFPTIYFLRRREERSEPDGRIRQTHPTILATVRASANE